MECHAQTGLYPAALLENEASQRAHRALGFEETERVVYFSKRI